MRSVKRLSSGEAAQTIVRQFFRSEPICWDELIMAFGVYKHPLISFRKLEEGNGSSCHELCANSTADQLREVLFAMCKVLLDLNDAYSVLPALGLHGKDVVRAVTVQADVNFVGFDLPKLLHATP